MTSWSVVDVLGIKKIEWRPGEYFKRCNTKVAEGEEQGMVVTTILPTFSVVSLFWPNGNPIALVDRQIEPCVTYGPIELKQQDLVET